jgi:hypothetical protein
LKEIIAFIGSVPELIRLINALVGWLKRVSGNDISGFISNMSRATQALNNAKTPEETDHALIALQATLAGKQPPSGT